MGKTDSSSSAGGGRRSKIARLIEEYELLGLGEELEQLWTAEKDRQSLRELASYFNRQLLTEVFRRADIQYLDGEIDNTYRLLTADDVSSAEKTRVERRLKREGVDIESLRGDFVTYQAIRSYLKDNRGAEYTKSNPDPLAREQTTVQKLRGRMVSVIEGDIRRLRDSNELSLGEFQTLADIQIVCEDCNSQFGVGKLLDRGGCDCQSTTK